MQLSKLRLNKTVEREMFSIFYQTMADLKGLSEAKTFVNDFLTKMERTALAKRLMTALYLEKGKSYEFIKKNLKVSSATIANVDKMMDKNGEGFSLALRKIEAEQWASQTAKKITSFFKKL